MSMLSFLPLLLLLLATLAAVIYLLVALLLLPALGRRGGARAPVRPPVTILLPVCGLEPELKENLRTFCRQDYPVFQVLFGVPADDDTAAAVVRRVMAEFPQADLQLLVGGATEGPDRCMTLLADLLPAARYPLLVIAGGELRVDRNFLTAVAAPFADPLLGGLVSAASGSPRGGLAATLGALGITDVLLPAALIAARLQKPEPFAAALTVRRQALEASGGFAPLAGHVAGISRLGQRLRQAGWQLRLSPYVVEKLVANATLSSLVARELRWARTFRLSRPAAYACGWLAAGAFPFALLFLLASGFSPAGWGMLSVTALLRLGLHYRLRTLLRGAPQPLPWLLPLRDFFSLGIWAAGTAGRWVRWRHWRLQLGRQGRIERTVVEPPHLVVTVDGFGLNLSLNETVEQAHRQGLVTAAGLVIGGEAADDAAERAGALPTLRVGLQLVLTGGWPLLSPAEIPDLVTADGRFRDRQPLLLCGAAVRHQLEKEIRAQFAAFAATGLPLDHLSLHKPRRLPPAVLKMAVRIGREFGLGAVRLPPLGAGGSFRGLFLWRWKTRRDLRRAGLRITDHFFDLPAAGGGDRETLQSLLRDPPPGLTEIRVPLHADPLPDRWAESPFGRSGSPFSRGGYADAALTAEPTVEARLEAGAPPATG